MGKHYINNEEFLKSLTEYRKSVRKAKRDKIEKPAIPNYIGECFMKIANNLATKPNFANYSFRDEMVGDAIENCLMYFENFDPKKSKNPFAYFTQIVFYAFLRRIAKENKNQYVKYKIFENQILHSGELTATEENSLKPSEIYANISEFTTNFEQKQKKKRKTVVKKGLEKFYNE
jgi:hypothetical protein